MKRSLLLLGATALLVAQSPAQEQSAQIQNDITPAEFRQVFLDLGSYVDAHKGTDLRRQFEAIPDSVLMKFYPAIANPRQFQSAVATLTQENVAQGRQSRPPHKDRLALQQATPNAASNQPLAAFPACPPNSIIDDSPGALCTPSYPDSDNLAWQILISAPHLWGAFQPNDRDLSEVSRSSCNLTATSALSVAANSLTSVLTAASAVCSALPPVASNLCWLADTAAYTANGYLVGTWAACQVQGGLVTGAQTEAAFHNTVTTYNAVQGLNTQLTGLNTLNTQLTALDTHLTNVDNHVAVELAALDAHLVALINQLTNQTSQTAALLDAHLKQVMKLQLTPDGQKSIDPAMLKCTGADCPAVLAACPAAGCSWNNTGPR